MLAIKVLQATPGIDAASLDRWQRSPSLTTLQQMSTLSRDYAITTTLRWGHAEHCHALAAVGCHLPSLRPVIVP
jgi:hypothetical protein